MKKIIKILLVVFLMVAMCTGCTNEDAYGEGYKDGYEVGYDKGLSKGLKSGEELAREDINYTYENDIVPIDIEDVVSTLWCYADINSGEDISEERLRESIWKILEYYDEVEEYHTQLKN